MKASRISVLLKEQPIGANIIVQGWVRTFRNNQFIALSDGSTVNTLQVVVDFEKTDPDIIKKISTGAAVEAEGTVVESQGRGQSIELKADRIQIHGEADPEKYPLQPKRHSMEFLREIAHLRFRTNTFGAVFRVRHALAFAIHKYFNDHGFYYLHTPIVTASDAEGAGEMFRVTTLDLQRLPTSEDGLIDYKQDFFERETHLTVSGQLEAELGALALSKVYTFGPTFRAENSNTSRHLAEFWMIEPEVAFCDLHDNMDLAESMLKYITKYVMDECADDLAFLNDRYVREESSKPKHLRSEMNLLEKLAFVVEHDFERLTYTEAIDILRASKPNKKKKFSYVIDGWGADLQSEHERYLVEKHFKRPVILTDYPKQIKAFYMRMNDDDKTVGAMDILFPGIGEIVGGSQREERLDVLKARMAEMDIPTEELYWYLDTRIYGSCPHAGYGLGFERLVLFVTGMSNIRDVIAFPRTPGSANF